MALSKEDCTATASLQHDYIWEYQSNVDPRNQKQKPTWTPYSPDTSASIEQVYQQQCKQIVINDNYCIDLKGSIQQHLKDPYRQRPVRRRRCHCSSTISTTGESQGMLAGRERLSSFLGVPSRCSVTGNTDYYGSAFVHDWLLLFSEGQMRVTFDRIFPVLADGLIQEGQAASGNEVREIEKALRNVGEETHGKSAKKRIAQLQACCAALYTKDSYLYRTVNAALRDDDRTKLDTLGPFCYLLFNYIGQRRKDKSAMHDRLRRVFHPIDAQSITLYRGDRASDETIEEYRQAVGDPSKHFKWLPFISTSRKQEVAECFAPDVLYIMAVRSCSLKEDQFRDVAMISDYPGEEEILLLPGVQFQVTELKFSNEKGIHLVHININSSYVSKLK